MTQGPKKRVASETLDAGQSDWCVCSSSIYLAPQAEEMFPPNHFLKEQT